MSDCPGCRDVEVDSYGNFPDGSALERLKFLGEAGSRDDCGDYVEDREHLVRCRTCGEPRLLRIHGDYSVLGVTWSAILTPMTEEELKRRMP